VYALSLLLSNINIYKHLSYTVKVANMVT